MIDFVDLKKIQADFSLTRQEYGKRIKQAEKNWKQFLRLFPKKNIKNLSLDSYVIGKQSENSFCHWVENRLNDLGNIHGNTSFKFGIYFGKTKSDPKNIYRFTKKFGKNKNEAFVNVRNEIVKLLDSAEKNNLEELRKNKISPMFKGKILFLYFPDKYLNIFSGEHLSHYLDELGIQHSRNLDEIDKRQLLLNYKIQDEVMSEWSTLEFSMFLWYIIRPPLQKKDVPEKLRKHLEFREDYPDIKDINPVFVEINIIPGTMPLDETKKKTSKLKKVDFEQENRRFRIIGEQGEEAVLKAEKEYLISIGKKKLAKDVKRVSKDDDTLGYDILSFDDNEEKKYIEVKSTRSSISEKITFNISENQCQKARNLNNYYLYIVFNVKTENPLIWKLKNPLDHEKKGFTLSPIKYLATIYIQEK